MTAGTSTDPVQLPLITASPTGHRVQRTVHYLGSKLRLLDPIQEAVAAVVPDGQPVCDLFAGSGTVSLALASRWKVTSVDIQEYSRVLCSGLLGPTPVVEGGARGLRSSWRLG